MKVAVFSTKPYDRLFLEKTNQKYGHELSFFSPSLNTQTASLAQGFAAVCVFVNDLLDRDTLQALHQQGVKLIALRCAGYNNIDLKTARELELMIVRVPAYSPHAVAEARSCVAGVPPVEQTS